jgi:hypothetical protein
LAKGDAAAKSLPAGLEQTRLKSNSSSSSLFQQFEDADDKEN